VFRRRFGRQERFARTHGGKPRASRKGGQVRHHHFDFIEFYKSSPQGARQKRAAKSA
jgi:hypothetical protein